jgi:hypothetical protein
LARVRSPSFSSVSRRPPVVSRSGLLAEGFGIIMLGVKSRRL